MGKTGRSQAAGMAIAPGKSEGGPGNAHAADQWLYVLAGTGRAIVEGKTVRLKAGALLLIAKGEEHEIKNTGRRPLRTLSIYAPPAY